MRKFFFKSLAKLNKRIMPSFAHKDLTKLKGWEKALVAYRYYITKNALD